MWRWLGVFGTSCLIGRNFLPPVIGNADGFHDLIIHYSARERAFKALGAILPSANDIMLDRGPTQTFNDHSQIQQIAIINRRDEIHMGADHGRAHLEFGVHAVPVETNNFPPPAFNGLQHKVEKLARIHDTGRIRFAPMNLALINIWNCHAL
jgi:hypothetical protein